MAKGTERALRVAGNGQGLEPLNFTKSGFFPRGSRTVSITNRYKWLIRSTTTAVRTTPAGQAPQPEAAAGQEDSAQDTQSCSGPNTARGTRLHRPAPRALLSHLHRSSRSRACRKACAVSLGAITKRLSERLHIADRRGGVTKTHGLGQGAERDESRGSRGDAVSA